MMRPTLLPSVSDAYTSNSTNDGRNLHSKATKKYLDSQLAPLTMLLVRAYCIVWSSRFRGFEGSFPRIHRLRMSHFNLYLWRDIQQLGIVIVQGWPRNKNSLQKWMSAFGYWPRRLTLDCGKCFNNEKLQNCLDYFVIGGWHLRTNRNLECSHGKTSHQKSYLRVE